SFPNAFPIKTAPGTFSRKRLPPCGRIAVTPVRMFASRTIVEWPTITPGTSVMALSCPGGNTPTITPASRARGRCSFCADDIAGFINPGARSVSVSEARVIPASFRRCFRGLISIEREKRNDCGNNQPQQTLYQEKHEAPESEALDPFLHCGI